MIISNTAKGPSYSVDATAYDVARFVASRSELASAPQSYVTGGAIAASLEDLYPSLFQERATFSDRARSLAAAIIAKLSGKARAARRAAAVSALVLAISGMHGNAGAASQVYGMGAASAPSASGAYDAALEQAREDAADACAFGELISERVIATRNSPTAGGWNAEVEVASWCV